MEEFVMVFAIIAGGIIALLPVILFFKVWGMCNDVSKIREILEKR